MRLHESDESDEKHWRFDGVLVAMRSTECYIRPGPRQPFAGSSQISLANFLISIFIIQSSFSFSLISARAYETYSSQAKPNISSYSDPDTPNSYSLIIPAIRSLLLRHLQ